VLEGFGIPYTSVGGHAGGSPIAKAAAVAGRSARLWRWARGRGFDGALAHGSVDIAVVSRALRIPLVQMNDYEYAGIQRRVSFRGARLVMAPDAIPVEAMERAGARRDRLFRYPGLKEDYYLADFRPDSAVLAELGLDRDRVLTVVRPPPESSAYHARNPLYERVIDRLTDEEAVTVVIPRTESQRAALGDRGARPRWDELAPPLVVPDHAIDAQSLIAFADVVVSAGGTMNREAVALGTPVYTIFTGEMGAVDERLIAAGKLLPLSDPAAIELAKRQAGGGPVSPRDPQVLVDAVLAGLQRRG
jgi:predicted glycosyltransferase